MKMQYCMTFYVRGYGYVCVNCSSSLIKYRTYRIFLQTQRSGYDPPCVWGQKKLTTPLYGCFYSFH